MAHAHAMMRAAATASAGRGGRGGISAGSMMQPRGGGAGGSARKGLSLPEFNNDLGRTADGNADFCFSGDALENVWTISATGSPARFTCFCITDKRRTLFQTIL